MEHLLQAIFKYIVFQWRHNVCGCSLAVTSTGPGEFMVFVVLCLGAPEGSTGSGSVLKCLRRKGYCLKSHPTDWESRESNSGLLGTR